MTEKIDFASLKEIVYSNNSPEQKYYLLMEEAKKAKMQGMSQEEAGDLFGKLWDIDDFILSEMDGYISSVLEIIYGYCAESSRIWPDVWEPKQKREYRLLKFLGSLRGLFSKSPFKKG